MKHSKFLHFSLILTFLVPLMPYRPANLPQPGTISFGMVTDTHCENKEDSHTSGLKKAVAHFNQLPLSFVIELGDSIRGSGDLQTVISEYHHMNRVYSEAKAPRYYVIGNHDVVANYTVVQNADLWKSVLGQPSTYHSFDKNGFHFIVLDSISFNSTQLDWLKSDLESNQEKTIVFSHYPIISYDSVGIGWMAGDGSIRSVLEASGNVIAAFNGHLHKNVVKTEKGISYFGINDLSDAGERAVVTVYPSGAVEVRGYGKAGIYGQDSYYLTGRPLFEQYWANTTKIEINKSMIQTLNENHLLKIDIHSKSIISAAQPNGEDIRFASVRGSTLSYHIERWDRNNNEAVIWVKIPAENQVDSHIDMFFGNPSAMDAQDEQNVGRTNYIVNRFSSFKYVTGNKIQLTHDDVESPVCVWDVVSNAENGRSYNTTYNPPGIWDWSEPGLVLSTWLNSNLGSNGSNSTRLYLVDTRGNYLFWDVSLRQNRWENIQKSLSEGKPSAVAPDLKLIDKIVVEFVPSGNTEFYKKIGWTEMWKEHKKTGYIQTALMEDVPDISSNLTEQENVSAAANTSPPVITNPLVITNTQNTSGNNSTVLQISPRPSENIFKRLLNAFVSTWRSFFHRLINKQVPT